MVRCDTKQARNSTCTTMHFTGPVDNVGTYRHRHRARSAPSVCLLTSGVFDEFRVFFLTHPGMIPCIVCHTLITSVENVNNSECVLFSSSVLCVSH
eukprot:m.243168 g.243168  ORF g.243168 m.243168 type:complete len:96 (+) comp19443_c1_seq18:6872-7159(+)